MRSGEKVYKYGNVKRIDYYRPKGVLNPGSGFMSEYDYTLNIYRGCAFGCTYCYAAFFTKNDEEQKTWGEWLSVKENVVELFQRMPKGSLDGKTIYMSTTTDPYQPVERKLELTRKVLEILARNHRPHLVVQTRSPLVCRDRDHLRSIIRNGGKVQVNMTVTTDDEKVRKAFEPDCPSNKRRLEAVLTLAKSGIRTCVTMTPLLAVRDIDEFVQLLKGSGAHNFIVQNFHAIGGNTKYVAGTRNQAYEALANLYEVPVHDFQSIKERSKINYDRCLEVFRRELPNLGEGKQGFAPPFEDDDDDRGSSNHPPREGEQMELKMVVEQKNKSLYKISGAVDDYATTLNEVWALVKSSLGARVIRKKDLKAKLEKLKVGDSFEIVNKKAKVNTEPIEEHKVDEYPDVAPTHLPNPTTPTEAPPAQPLDRMTVQYEVELISNIRSAKVKRADIAKYANDSRNLGRLAYFIRLASSKMNMMEWRNAILKREEQVKRELARASR